MRGKKRLDKTMHRERVNIVEELNKIKIKIMREAIC
jgi:hypothetical protein